MRLAVSGASGKTGYRIAEEAIKAGHKVRLIVRPSSIIPNSLKSNERYVVTNTNGISLDYALKNCDGLVIATGARPSIDLTGPAKVDAIGVQQQVESCKRLGIKRVILVSSLCAGRLFHPLNLFGLILMFKKLGEQALQSSGLDWTIVRPGGLNENEDNIDKENILYSSENIQEEGSIPRRLVAKTCVDCINEKYSFNKIVEVTSSKENPSISLNSALQSFNI